MVNFEDFKKLDIRIAKIIKAEKVQGSDKLLNIQIDLGDEKRQIIAGIAKSYSLESLIGKQVIVVVNLEPRTVFGLESRGMLLAAKDQKENLAILIPDKEIITGSKVR